MSSSKPLGTGRIHPSVFDERRVERLVDLEMGSLHHGLVIKKRSLQDLLGEEEPRCVTREGEDYLFDREVLERLAAVTSEAERRSLRLPLTLRFHADLQNQASLDDELEAEVLRRLEGFGKAYQFREGRMWIPYSLAMQIMLKYPTAFQRVLTL